MKVLLDTHAFLWLVDGDSRLSQRAKEIFLAEENALFLSAASLWEIAVKLSLGKLELAKDWADVVTSEMSSNRIQWLPVELVHCAELSKLPFHHRDPFDRMLISQAVCENMAVLSRDPVFSDYPIQIEW